MRFQVRLSSKNQNGSSELKHYGILGMKWGVRRTPEQLGHRKIKAGTKMYRTTASKDESKETGSTYVTYLQIDRDKYRGAGADLIRQDAGLKKGDQLFETEYVLKEDLNIPSRKEQSKVVNSLRERKGGEYLKEYVNRLIERDMPDEDTYIKSLRDMRVSPDKASDDYLKRHRIIEMKNYAIDAYYLYKDMDSDTFFREVSKSFGVDQISRQDVIDELSKRGYNAMVDIASVGGGKNYFRSGDDALIIFDRQKTLEKQSTEPISKKTEKKAIKDYYKWYVRANNPLWKNDVW